MCLDDETGSADDFSGWPDESGGELQSGFFMIMIKLANNSRIRRIIAREHILTECSILTGTFC